MAYSEYSMDNINIEESKILIEEKWLTLNELKKNIKNKINADDYNINHLATAVQELSEALDNITQVKLTLHVDIIDSFKEVATNNDSTFENALRDALINRVDHGLTSSMTRSQTQKGSKDTETKGYKPKKVACKKCHAVIVVDSPERPITVTCPECGTKGKLSK